MVKPEVPDVMPSARMTDAPSQEEVTVPVVNTGKEYTVTETGKELAVQPLGLLTVTK